MITELLNSTRLRGLLHRAGHRGISDASPKVLVIGVGGAGGNALNNMIRGDLRGVEFCAVNTDVQALAQSLARRKMQIGPHATRGLGAGARVGFGQIAAEESLDAIKDLVRGNDIVFVTAGMGGGTGTGAAPVIAGLARRFGILTVGVITKPFDFEGEHRLRLAEGGVAEMAAVTDTLLIIPNQNLFRVADKQTTLLDAFKMADEVLHAGVRAVTDLMTVPGLVNLDFADVRTIMKDMGQATMGTGEAEGENRASIAAAAAMSNPLVEQGSMSGARGVLINVTGGADLTLFDMNEAVDRVRREAAATANIIFGSTFDKRLRGRIRISIVATGIGPGSPAATFDVRQGEDIVDYAPWGLSADDAVVASPAAAGQDRRRGLLGAATGLAVIAAVGAGGASLLRGESAPAGALEASDDAAGDVSLAADTIPAAADVTAPLETSPPPAPDGPNVAADDPAASPPPIAAGDPGPRPPKHKPKAPRVAVVQAVPGQGYSLQIGALRDAASAQEELTRLRRTQADLLTGLDSHASRFELVDQGSVWRIRVGPIADRATAEAICSGLKQRGAQCLLLGPSVPLATSVARR